VLIYCSHLWLRPEAAEERFLDAAATWLSQKSRGPFKPSDLVDGCKKHFAPNNVVEVARADSPESSAIAIRLRHPDGAIRGRNWLTDMGLRRQDGAVLASVTLTTEETSRFVPPVAETTRPRIVSLISERCQLDSRTVGGPPRPLRVADAEAFDYRIKDGEREFPIVLISSDRDGRYIVDPERVASLLLGLAEVAVIPVEEDTFSLADILGERFSAYWGAVAIIWRRARFGDRDFIPSTKLVPEQLLEIQAGHISLESHILARVCHRTNGPLSGGALTLEEVRRMATQLQLSRALHERGTDAAELQALCRTVDVEQREQIDSLKKDMAQRDEECDQLRDEVEMLRKDIKDLHRDNNSLRQSLRAAGATRPSGLSKPLNTSLLLECMYDEPTLEACLDVIESLFPERVVILPSARSSAKKSSEFKYPRRALKLLANLCGPFWTMLSEGKGTNEAKEVLGDAYAANESKSARDNSRAKDLRTFVYENQPVEMMQHLKIGVKQDSYAETWRAHFHWDAERRRIVIGHCGAHLDHK
jgi:hypothetical protein